MRGKAKEDKTEFVSKNLHTKAGKIFPKNPTRSQAEVRPCRKQKKTYTQMKGLQELRELSFN
jgi:hypothetical protein